MGQQHVKVEPVTYGPVKTAEIILMLADFTVDDLLAMYPYYLQPGREDGLALLQHELDRRAAA